MNICIFTNKFPYFFLSLITPTKNSYKSIIRYILNCKVLSYIILKKYSHVILSFSLNFFVENILVKSIGLISFGTKSIMAI